MFLWDSCEQFDYTAFRYLLQFGECFVACWVMVSLRNKNEYLKDVR